MEKLKAKINKRINELEDTKINDNYKTAMELFNKELKKPYYKVNFRSYPIYIYLLMLSELGEEQADKIKAIMSRCNLFFGAHFNKTFYDKFYDVIEKLFELDSLNKLNTKESEKYKNIFNNYATQALDIYYDNVDNFDPIKAVCELYELLPNKDIFLSFTEFEIIKDIYQDIEDSVDEYACLISKKNYQKSINKSYEDSLKLNDFHIQENYKKIMDCYANVLSKHNKNNRDNKKIKKNYQILLTKLSEYKNHYIDNIDKFINLIEDEEVLSEFLYYVTIHNTSFNTKVDEENKMYKKEQISNIEIIFNKYNYNINQLSDEYLVRVSTTKDLEAKLSVLNTSKLNINPSHILFTKLLLNLSLDSMKYISYLISENIIDETFLIKHQEILEDKRKFINFKLNIELLNDYLKEIAKFDKDIFAIDNDLINDRLNLMYKYKININNLYNFEFLKNNEIFNLLDNFIELGYYEQIKQNPNYLSMDNALMIKRLQVAHLIDMNVVNLDNSFIGSIVSGKDFYINNEKLDDFIIDYTDQYTDSNIISNININSQDEQDLEMLMDYEIESGIYRINDILLSKNRILRNLHILKKQKKDNIIMNAILLGSINLSQQDISFISKIVGINVKTKTNS